MTDRELMQQALDVLEKIGMGGDPRWADDVAPILRARLAQPEPKREWQGLTDEEIKQLWKDTPQLVGVYSYTDIAREVEAKLKEKNT